MKQPGTVHPHACGEHELLRKVIEGKAGSSPRMWGTRYLFFLRKIFERFIPTHVGNTSLLFATPKPCTVHPHACGEHYVPGCVHLTHPGSSPRMWGTHRPLCHDMSQLRFIPTHVGNTNAAGNQDLARAVHPHACGEHILFPLVVLYGVGSSPRMWGTRICRP